MFIFVWFKHSGRRIFIVNPALGDHLVVEKTERMLYECWQAYLAGVEASKASYFYCLFLSMCVNS